MSRPSPLPGATQRQMSTSSATSTPPPPPYAYIQQNQLVEEPDAVPPPVPPRSPPRHSASRNRTSVHIPPSSSTPPSAWAHRRTVSHSTPSRNAQQGNLADGVGGFRAQLTADETGSHNSLSPPLNQLTSVPIPTRSNTRSREDPLLLLKKYDTVIVVDDSASMAGPLWFEARYALAGVAEIAGKYDADGIDVHFLNDRRAGLGLRTAREVERLFDRVSPDGITPTGEKLEELLLAYLLELEKARDLADAGDPGPLHAIKPVNFIVLTDGAPTDDPESVIVTAARRLDARNFPISQVGIQFVQIGNDPTATQALQELDDDLAGHHGIRDMVDTTPYAGGQVDSQMLTKILLGGINRRVDKRGAD